MIKQNINKKFNIEALHTYSISWAQQLTSNLILKLVKGSAEILGQQLITHENFQITPGATISIFTWEGCQIEYFSNSQTLTSQPGVDLTNLQSSQSNRQSPMNFYMNLHYNLTLARRSALETGTLGPRVMIIGENKQQKNDIEKLLINYATKINMEPILVDLDLENLVFCDGCIGAVHIKSKFPKNFIEYDNKVAFFYGTTKLYKKTYLIEVQALAKSTMQKVHKQIKAYKQRGLPEEYPYFCTGLIINVPNLKTQSSAIQREIIQDIIKQFDVTHAVVLEDTTTLAYLSKQHPKIQRLGAPKLESYKIEKAKGPSKIETYFNGSILYLNGQPLYQNGSPMIGFVYKREVTLNLTEVNLYELKISEDDKPYCAKLDLSEMAIVKEVITILHTKNDTNDEFVLAHKALTTPISCLARIHSIEHGKLVLYVINQKFLELYKHNLWIYGKIN